MKFNEGNIITHTPTATRWIVLRAQDRNKKESRCCLEVDALCIYVGTHKRAIKYWKVHESDTWALTPQDLAPTDTVWKVEYAHQ